MLISPCYFPLSTRMSVLLGDHMQFPVRVDFKIADSLVHNIKVDGVTSLKIS